MVNQTGGLARWDHALSQVANVFFSMAQAMAAVVVPLLAVQAGHAPTTVGLIVALAAISQTIARLGMGRLMNFFPTKHFIVVAAALLAASCAVLAISHVMWAFVISQLLQGAARAYFWTGAQTHVVRASDSSVVALSKLNMMQGAGQLAGPLLAGILGVWSLPISLWVAAGFSAVAVVPAVMLIRFAPFKKRTHDLSEAPRSLWANPGIRIAGNMTGIAGGWRGILNSYLPVILSASGYGVHAVGILITVTNLSALGGSASAKWAQIRGPRFSLGAGGLSAGLGLCMVAFFPEPVILAVLFLVISGWGAGVLQTVGPALSADSVDAEDRGRSIALIGTFRSVSLLLSPLIGAGLVFVMPSVAIATAVSGAIVATPALAALKKSKSAE